MKKKAVWLFIIVLTLLGLAGGLYYARWSSAIRQPLNFSHSSHVTKGISCDTCHSLENPRVLPPQDCKTCHQNLNPNPQVQWIRVYRVAPDIIFSHRNHNRDCSVCHIDFTSAKSMIHESRYKMDFCMECHDQTGASNKCGACHKNM